MIGVGKYDDLLTPIREQLEADGIALIVIGGKMGSGFSMQANAQAVCLMPGLFEQVAVAVRADVDQIAADLRDGNVPPTGAPRPE